MDALQQHALLVGQISSGFFSERQLKEDAFVVGLLHDIGKLLLAVELPEHFEKVLQAMKQSGCSMHAMEQEVWGVTHAEVGGYLLGLWGLPHPIIEAVANHHAPSRVASTDFGIFAAVHIADALVHDELDPREAEPFITNLDVPFLDYLGVTNKVDAWRDNVRRQLGQLG